MKRRWPAVAAMVAIVGGAYGGYEYQRSRTAESHAGHIETSAAEAEAKRKVATEALQRQIALETEKRQREQQAAAARQRQSDMEEEQRHKEMAEAHRQAAEKQRREEARIAALDEDRRQAEAEEKRRRAALEDARRKEETRIASLEEARSSEAKLKDDERIRLATIPDDANRAEFVRKVQQVLRSSRCDDGALTGRSSDAQEGLNKFVQAASKRSKSKPERIELAKASIGDFETWLRDARVVEDGLCVPKPAPKSEKPAPVASSRRAPAEREPSRPRPQAAPSFRGGGGSAPTMGIGN